MTSRTLNFVSGGGSASQAEHVLATSFGNALPPRLPFLLELARNALHSCHAGIVVLSAEGNLQEFLPASLTSEDAALIQRSGWPERIVAHVLRQPLPTRIPDLIDSHANLALPAGTAGNPRSLLAVPLNCGARRGAIYFLRCAPEGAFTAKDEEVVAPLAAWLSADGWSGEFRLLNQLGMLNRIAQQAATHLDVRDLFRVALAELDRHLPLYPCAIWLFDNDKPESESKTGESRCELVSLSPCLPVSASEQTLLEPGLRINQNQTVFIRCLEEGQAQYTDLAQREAPPPQQNSELETLLSGIGASCCFSVPLRAGDRTLGVLQSICLRPLGFTVDHIQLLYRVADLIGPAISNCQLFAQLKKAYEDLNETQHLLIQAEKLRALGELASGMAHEFNNALCGVLGFLELTLFSKTLDPTCRRQLELARTSAQDAAETVRRVQDFARQRRGNQVVQPVNIDHFVMETLEMIRHKWDSAGRAQNAMIQVEVATGSRAVVLGNSFELREVLTNLVFNAVDAMPNGGTLAIQTRVRDGRAYLAVRDTGVGMSEAVRLKIFEPFFSTKGEKGNGLGLSVTFAIVRRHGGDIGVESAPGKGTTFTIKLPLAPEGTTEVEAAKPLAMSEGVKGQRLLVVEDEEAVREFLAVALKQMGHRVRLAADGLEGLRAVREEPFDVVLTDMGLPGVGGDVIIQAVADRYPGTPVLLLTGWGEQMQRDHGSIPGVTQILAKPISLDTLVKALNSAIAARPSV